MTEEELLQVIEQAAEIVQLTNLQSLDLSRNQLSNLPAEIGKEFRVNIWDFDRMLVIKNYKE